MNVKMNYKRALLISLPFFAITMFWQAYDTILPQILAYHYGLNSVVYGAIMGLDNLVALFFLPFFGALSDRCNAKLGRRTPFILLGTLGGMLGFIGMSVADRMQLDRLNAAGIPARYAAAVGEVAQDAVMAEIAQMRQDNLSGFILFFAFLLIAVFLMSIVRSPAVALAPDIFIRPLRSKAIAVVNASGSLAGIIFLVFNRKLAELFGGGFTRLIFVAAGVMLIALTVYMLFVHERQFVEDAQKKSEELGLIESVEATNHDTVLTPERKRSLFLILTMVVLMYMGYNAYNTHFAVYAISYMGMTSASISGPLLVRVLVVMLLCVPAAMLAEKIGRKRCCAVGFVMAGVAIFSTYFLTADSSGLLSPIFVLMAAGIALVSVNAGPMVTELCNDKDNGKYTGYYYLATSVAQIVTPAIAGFFMRQYGNAVLPIYATVFYVLGFGVTLFIRHGDAAKLPGTPAAAR